MKSIVLSIFVYCAYCSPVFAASLFENPGQWISDTGNSAGQAIGKTADNLADVITLGKVGRDRDEARANEAKREAELQAQAAAELHKKQVEKAESDVLSIQQNIKLLTEYIATLNTSIEQLNADLKVTRQLYTLARKSDVYDSTYIDVLRSQTRADQLFVKNMLEKDPQNNALLTFSEKQNQYDKQLQSIPKEDEGLVFEQVFRSHLEQIAQLRSLMTSEGTSKQESLNNLTNELTEKNAALTALKGQ